MGWSGYYINLDRSPARRQAIEAQLATCGLTQRYRRFPACDGRTQQARGRISAGETGIFSSHVALLRVAASADGLTHVIEDDVRMSRPCGPFIDALEQQRLHDTLDVIVTDTGIALDMVLYHALRRFNLARTPASPVQVVDISGFYRWGLTSYVISPAGARKVLAAAEAAWNDGPAHAIDIVLANAVKAGRISIGCSVPLLTWLDMPHASLSLAERKDESPLTHLVQRLARYPFFVDADIDGFLVPALRNLIAGANAHGENHLRDAGRRALRSARMILADCEERTGARR